ncbi:NAD-dependent epimerase/dehydratase family protein [Devosia sp. CAU 1758]
MGKRIIFTGGSGKAGRHAVAYLVAQGHTVLNLDLKPLDIEGVNTLITDLTDSGQVFNALSIHFGFEGFETGKGPAPVDAVVHFAAIPRVLIHPDNETFKANVTSTYNVIEAATKLGIRKIVIASSETTYGVCFAEGDKDYQKFPLEEDYDVDPMDSYGLSKLVNEKTARAFAMRTGADIYALRIGNVIEPEDYARFPTFLADPPSRKRNAWSYIDARDLGQIVALCIAKDGLGFQVFNAVNDEITANEPSEAFLARWAPNTPIARPIEAFEAPISNRKIRDVLGFKENHNWRQHVPGAERKRQ